MGFDDFGFFSFGIFGIMFFLVFFLAIGAFILSFVKAFQQWNKNNHSPRLTVPATIVAKRANVSRHRHHGNGPGIHHTTSSTTYFVTFQVDSGDRMELHMTGHEYGLLIEGDCGFLTFQGTRYLGFERKIEE